MCWFPFRMPPLYLFADLLAEKSRGLYDENKNKNAENYRVRPEGGDVPLRELLDDTEHDTAGIAPGIEPMPPKTAAVNALIPGIEPVVGLMYVYVAP